MAKRPVAIRTKKTPDGIQLSLLVRGGARRTVDSVYVINAANKDEIKAQIAARDSDLRKKARQ